MPYLVWCAMVFCVGFLIGWLLYDHEPETTINWLRNQRRRNRWR